MTHLFVFACAFFADVGWTLYFMEIEKDRAMRAGVASMFIVLCGCLSSYEYVNHLVYTIDACLGSFAGVVVTMRWKQIRAWVIDQRPDPADRTGSGKTGL